MEAVKPVRFWQEHERALPSYDVHSLGAAEVNRARTDGSRSDPAVQPNPVDAGGVALAYDAIGGSGPGHEQGAVHRGGDIADSRVAGIAADVFERGIDGRQMVSAALHFEIERAREIFGVAGDSHNRQPLLCKEFVNLR